MDCIDRQTVLDLVDKGYLISNGNYGKVRKLIEDIPSVQICEDAISRQAAIDIINGIDSFFAKYIDALPSVQPEIVRCKDCEDYQTDWVSQVPEKQDRHYCATMDSFMPPDGFCSFAERKKDG